ncbi:MAG: SDR family NAD(P)-dependent oxidoreductase, partial [Clostridia bacterium]|nr:SDR family NAD(P)-dependent oxidoreductase [Clostridia bacterium]
MKIAIITGASSGMGKEFAYRLSKENDVDELWLVARRKDRLCEIAENIDKPCRILSFDLSNPDMIEELEKIIGRKKPDIKWLVNSAGYGLIGNFEEFDGIRQSGVVSVNCTALTAVTGICLPH